MIWVNRLSILVGFYFLGCLFPGSHAIGQDFDDLNSPAWRPDGGPPNPTLVEWYLAGQRAGVARERRRAADRNEEVTRDRGYHHTTRGSRGHIRAQRLARARSTDGAGGVFELVMGVVQAAESVLQEGRTPSKIGNLESHGINIRGNEVDIRVGRWRLEGDSVFECTFFITHGDDRIEHDFAYETEDGDFDPNDLFIEIVELLIKDCQTELAG